MLIIIFLFFYIFILLLNIAFFKGAKINLTSEEIEIEKRLEIQAIDEWQEKKLLKRKRLIFF